LKKVLSFLLVALLFTGCKGENQELERMMAFRASLLSAMGCNFQAVITADYQEELYQFTLDCSCDEQGTLRFTVLEPETISGIRAVLDDTNWHLEYENTVLNAMPVSSEKISPAECLPFLMASLRDGWVLEENTESWNDHSCYRVTVDRSGEEEKILSTLWISQEDMTPLRGEISVGGEIILTAEFTSFSFYDTIEKQGE